MGHAEEPARGGPHRWVFVNMLKYAVMTLVMTYVVDQVLCGNLRTAWVMLKSLQEVDLTGWDCYNIVQIYLDHTSLLQTAV